MKKIKVKKVEAYPFIDLTSKNDPNGSYTGCPVDGGEPVQDADDL